MKIFNISFLIYLFYLLNVQSAKESDLVNDLPGWDYENVSPVYAGHIGIQNNTKFLTYMFFEATSPKPNVTPVVLWMQGGPGASGFTGLFTEFGPFNLNEHSFNGSEVPNLLHNPYSWTNNAHFIFFESPAGVGYTYCEGDCPVNTDETAAADAYDFLLKFFEEFGEYSNLPFYIAGESYGGIYVPMLAEQILENTNTINFKGILVGNGCTGLNSVGGCGPDSTMTLMEFLHGHGQISTKSFENFKTMCKEGNKEDCEEAQKIAMAGAGEFFEYHLYDECYAYEADQQLLPPPTYGYPCFQDQALYTWMTSGPVKDMFGVDKDWITHDGYWDLYKSTKDDVLPIYKKCLDNNISVLIFYGDTDPGVPYNGGQKWIDTLELKLVHNWQPWTLDGATEVAGYVTEYENNFFYVTVRGSGHMVPRYKPHAALVMFETFIFGNEFPTYNN